MNEEEFKSLARIARQLSGNYGLGYLRGLRRGYHGEAFGTEEEHSMWLRFRTAEDQRAEMGRGYADGLEGKPPDPKQGRPAEIVGGRRVNLWLDAISIERAEMIGNGSVSAGVRKALELASLPTKP